jgi:putative DNA primase/helicase
MRKSSEHFAAGDGATQASGPESADGKVTRLQPKTKRSSLGPVDDNIADVFADEHHSDLRYVAAWGKWYEWTGKLWREDGTLRSFDLVRRSCKAQGIERAGMAKMVAAVHTLARADRKIAATVDQWDSDPMLLNTPDGIVDLTTGTVRKSDPSAYCTKTTTVGPRGDCPLFLKFLTEIMDGDKALIAYLQRAFGYCLTGDASEQALFFNYGGGANGKTVLMSTVSGILGDYCMATPIETFTESKSDRHPTELARLRGARLVTATETEAGRHWAESRIKELTGGERIAARFMHQNFFEYQPAFKPWLDGNHMPRLRSVGLAMRRRVNLIPFAVTIPEKQRDPNLAKKLRTEWSGILQWMVNGCLNWRRDGLAPPEAVTKATDAYFAGEDSCANWIADCCDAIPGFVTPSTVLFASWKAWAEKAGQTVGNSRQFREEVERLGAIHKHGRKGNYFTGLRIRRDAPNSQEGWGVKAGEGCADFAHPAHARVHAQNADLWKCLHQPSHPGGAPRLASVFLSGGMVWTNRMARPCGRSRQAKRWSPSAILRPVPSRRALGGGSTPIWPGGVGDG